MQARRIRTEQTELRRKYKRTMRRVYGAPKLMEGNAAVSNGRRLGEFEGADQGSIQLFLSNIRLKCNANCGSFKLRLFVFVSLDAEVLESRQTRRCGCILALAGK